MKFTRSSINQTLLGTDLPKLQTLDTFANFDKIQIVNSQDLISVKLNYTPYLDLHGCPNTTLTISGINFPKYINLNGCSSINFTTVDIDSNFIFVDFTNVNSIRELEVSDIDFTNESFSGILLAKTIIGIGLQNCIAGNLDLRSINCTNINIQSGTYESISVLDNLDMLYILNMQTHIHCKSAESIKVMYCDVSCEKIEINGGFGYVQSNYNKGIIGDIILSNMNDIILGVCDCNSISVTDCTNITMYNTSGDIYTITHATNSISFTNCTFSSFAVDYSSGSVEFANCSWIESDSNNHRFIIQNCDKTIEEFNFFPLSKCAEVILFNCPNFIFDDSTPDIVTFINSNTTKTPNSKELSIINCDLTGWSDKCNNLIIRNCDNLELIDMTNVSGGLYIFCNKNLKYFMANGQSYGINNPVDEYLQEDQEKFFRLNGFENVNYISNPNFVNKRLKYDTKYIVSLNQSSDLFDDFETIMKNGIISMNFTPSDESYGEVINTISVYGLYVITNNNSITNNQFIYNSITSNLIDSDIDNIINYISLTRFASPLCITSGKETIAKLEERLIDNPYRSNIILMSTSDSNSDSISNLFSINLIVSDQ